MTQQLRAGLVVTADARSLVGEMRQSSTAVQQLRREANVLGTELTRSGGSADRFFSTFTRARGVFRQLGADTKSASDSASIFAVELGREEDAFRRLLQAVDPAARAQAEFRAAQEQATRAVRLGITTNEEAARTLALLKAQQDAAAASLGRGATAASGFRTGMQNASYQFTDAVVQFQGGVAPAVIFAQQAPQLLGAFGAMGAALGLVAALAPPVISFFLGSADAAKDLDDVLGQLESSTDRVRDSLELLRAPDLASTFGNMTGSVREMTAAMLELERASELRNLRQTLDGLLKENIEATNGQQIWDALSGSRGDPARNAQQITQDNFARLTGGRGLNYDEFASRRSEIDALAKAGNAAQVTNEVGRLIRDMSAGGPVTEMNDQLVEILLKLGDVARKTAEVEAQFNGTAQAAKTWSAVSEAGIGIWDRVSARAKEINTDAKERLRIAQNELSLQQVISVFGEQSKQADAERARIARENYELELQRSGLFEGQRDQQMQIYDQTVASESATAAWAQTMASVGAEVRGILSAISSLSGGVVDRAAKQAELAALNAGRTVAQASAAGRRARSEAEFKGLEMGASPIGRAVVGVQRWWARGDEAIDDQIAAARDAARERDRKTRGGGGANAGLNAAASITAELAKVKPSYEADVAAAEAWRDKALASLKKTKTGYGEFADEVETIFKERMAKAYRDDLDRRTDWASGASRAILDLNKDTTSWADVAEAGVKKFAASGEEAFVKFATTGKASVGGLVDFVAEQFARLAFQQAILPGLNAVIGSVFPGISLSGGAGAAAMPTHHTGSPGVMRSYRLPGAGYGDTMRNDERLTVMRQGEQMLTSRALENAGALLSAMTALAARPVAAPAGEGLNLNIVNNSSAKVEGEVRESTGERGQRQYELVMSDAVSAGLSARGGKAARTLSSEYALRKPGIRRT